MPLKNQIIAELEACDQRYASLARLHSNYYKRKYPCPKDTSFSGLFMEEHKLILSADTLEEFQVMRVEETSEEICTHKA
jgi:nucleoid factor 1